MHHTEGIDMMIAKTIGTAVSIQKDERLDSTKLLIVSPADIKGDIKGDPFIAVDLVGAGEGELVIVVMGSTARMAIGSAETPADAAIVGILDSLSSSGKNTFFKN